MTTIVTPLGCSRSELNSERTKFREGAGGHEGESRSRAAEEKLIGTAAPLLARLSPKRGEVIDLVYFTANRSRRSRRSSASPRPEFVGAAAAMTALPRRAVCGGANNGGGQIFFSFFFLGLLLFHSLIGLVPHFFEVIGFRLTRLPW
jgi:hypothetical protein